MSALARFTAQLDAGARELELPYLDLVLPPAALAGLLAGWPGPGRRCRLVERGSDGELTTLTLWADGERVGHQAGELGEAGETLILDAATLWDLFPPGASAVERLAAALPLLGPGAAEHGVEGVPEDVRLAGAGRLGLAGGELAWLAGALVAAERRLVLGLIQDARCWVLSLHGERLRLVPRSREGALQAQVRRLRTTHQADLALAVDVAGGWAVSSHLEPFDLWRLWQHAGPRGAVGRLLRGYLAHARAVLAAGPMPVEVRGPGPVRRWVLADGRLTAASSPPPPEVLPLVVDVGLCRRILDTVLLSGGRRLAELVDGLLPARARVEQQEQQLACVGRLRAEDGTTAWLVLAGGEHRPGGVLWDGERWLAVLDDDGRLLHSAEDPRAALSLRRDGPGQLAVRWPEGGLTGLALAVAPGAPLAWGPGSWLAESDALAPCLPGLRGTLAPAYQTAPATLEVGARRWTLTDARASVTTLSGVRFRGPLGLIQTRLLAVPAGTGAPSLVGRARARARRPAPWVRLIEATGDLSLPADGPRLGAEGDVDRITVLIPAGARLHPLDTRATPLDSRGEVTLRLRGWLAGDGPPALVVLEHTLDLRAHLPEPAWADQVLRPTWTADPGGLAIGYGSNRWLRIDVLERRDARGDGESR